MKKTNSIFINFPKNGGVRQFSTSLFEHINGDIDFVDLSGSWKNRVQLIKYRKANIIFGNNNLWIYLFIIFMSGRLSIILHDHKLRVGASKKEQLNLWLFNIFINRFEQVIIHTKNDGEALSLLEKSNVYYSEMPPHGLPEFYDKLESFPKGFENSILCFGRIEDYKNFDYIAEAISTCPETKLTIAGSGKASLNLLRIVSECTNIQLINKYIDEDELISLMNGHQYVALPYKDITQTGIVELAGYFSKPLILSDIQQFSGCEFNGFTKVIPINDLAHCRFVLKYIENLERSEYFSMSEKSHNNFVEKMALWVDYANKLKINYLL